MVHTATIVRHRCPVCRFLMIVRCGQMICTNPQCVEPERPEHVDTPAAA